MCCPFGCQPKSQLANESPLPFSHIRNLEVPPSVKCLTDTGVLHLVYLTILLVGLSKLQFLSGEPGIKCAGFLHATRTVHAVCWPHGRNLAYSQSAMSSSTPPCLFQLLGAQRLQWEGRCLNTLGNQLQLPTAAGVYLAAS